MKSKPGSPDYCGHDLSHLFTLRVRLYNDAHDKRQIVIHAFEGPPSYGTHTRIDVEVRHGGAVIFPRGTLYCGIPGGTCTDGIAARKVVMSLVAMRPGDTDDEYFADYTPAQRDWAEEHGEALSCEAQSRYCDPETGGCCESEAEAKRLRKAYYAREYGKVGSS